VSTDLFCVLIDLFYLCMRCKVGPARANRSLSCVDSSLLCVDRSPLRVGMSLLSGCRSLLRVEMSLLCVYKVWSRPYKSK